MNQYVPDRHKTVESLVTMLIPWFAKGRKGGPERGDAVYQTVCTNVFLMRSHNWYLKSLTEELPVIYSEVSKTFMSLVGIKFCKLNNPFSFLKYSLESWLFYQTKDIYLPSTMNKLGQPNTNHLLRIIRLKNNADLICRDGLWIILFHRSPWLLLHAYLCFCNS